MSKKKEKEEKKVVADFSYITPQKIDDVRQLNPLTIVGVIQAGKTVIGVTRCGNLDHFKSELGINIATHRSQVTPFMVIDNPITKEIFDAVIVSAVASNINAMKQISLQNLRRTK
jgi:hypothetical protein